MCSVWTYSRRCSTQTSMFTLGLSATWSRRRALVTVVMRECFISRPSTTVGVFTARCVICRRCCRRSDDLPTTSLETTSLPRRFTMLMYLSTGLFAFLLLILMMSAAAHATVTNHLNCCCCHCCCNYYCLFHCCSGWMDPSKDRHCRRDWRRFSQRAWGHSEA